MSTPTWPGASSPTPSGRLERVLLRAGGMPLTYVNSGDDRCITHSTADAQLVSSETFEQLHAPALDVDIASALTDDGTGPIWWVDGLTRRQWATARAALAAAGLGGRLPDGLSEAAARTNGRARSPFVAAYQAHRRGHVDSSARHALMCQLGPQAEVTFGQLLALTDALLTPAPAGAPAPALARPWPLPLAGPVMLLASSRNHHLYLETELDWASYRSLLAGLTAAAIIEPGYLRACEARQASHLRLPWVRKQVPAFPAQHPAA